MIDFLAQLKRNESGATAVEYGLILALVFLAMLAAIQMAGTSAIAMWTSVSTTITNATA